MAAMGGGGESRFVHEVSPSVCARAQHTNTVSYSRLRVAEGPSVDIRLVFRPLASLDGFLYEYVYTYSAQAKDSAPLFMRV